MTDPALVDFMARIAAIQADIEAMKAENAHRISRGETIAYGEENFYEAGNELRDISKTIGKLYGE